MREQATQSFRSTLEERTVDVPPDLERALGSDERARSAFDAFSYSHRNEYVEWIQGAKTDPTRQKRIATALEMIKAGSSPKRAKRP